MSSSGVARDHKCSRRDSRLGCPVERKLDQIYNRPIPGTIPSKAAPPFAVFEGWEPRTRPSCLSVPPARLRDTHTCKRHKLEAPSVEMVQTNIKQNVGCLFAFRLQKNVERHCLSWRRAQGCTRRLIYGAGVIPRLVALGRELHRHSDIGGEQKLSVQTTPTDFALISPRDMKCDDIVERSARGAIFNIPSQNHGLGSQPYRNIQRPVFGFSHSNHSFVSRIKQTHPHVGITSFFLLGVNLVVMAHDKIGDHEVSIRVREESRPYAHPYFNNVLRVQISTGTHFSGSYGISRLIDHGAFDRPSLWRSLRGLGRGSKSAQRGQQDNPCNTPPFHWFLLSRG